MRISRRTSGGRGEYEVSEFTGGITAQDLFGRRIILDFGNGWRIDTNLYLSPQGKKRRLRRFSKTGMQVQRQLAAALMLPHPVRADEPLGAGVPVARADRYAIEHIYLADGQLLGTDAAQFPVQEVILQNGSYAAQELGFTARREQIEFIWQHAAELPDPIASLVDKHRQLLAVQGAIPAEAEVVVKDLQRVMTDLGADLGIVYRSEGEDVVPDLLKTLAWAQLPPAPPVAVQEIDPDDVEIKRRTVKDWKRWANARGAQSAKFRQEVRIAYNATCIVCGLHLPRTTGFNTAAGVDAAHILPWAEFDLDHVSNGLCLCRQHHWAFDEGLLLVTWHDGAYWIEVPDDVVNGVRAQHPTFSFDELLGRVGQIPAARLPQNPQHRPRPQFLELLNETL
jgi:putative restriction endonuclease